jgi:ATP-dependent Lon protease
MMQACSRDRARKPRTVGCGSKDLARDVASLPARDAVTLRQRWKTLFGADPSPSVGRSLMVSATSYRIQERALGGLKPATQRLLDRIVERRSELALQRIQERRATVRYIYERYLELGCVRQLSKELDERAIVSKVRISKKGIKSGGCRFSRGALYELLANPIHIGEIRHKQDRYPGLRAGLAEL